jgi:chloramphenicol-sensitive protein RarD
LNNEKKGTIYAILAFTFWGLVPIYFKLVGNVDAFEVLIHRILWSILFLSLLLFNKKSFNSFILMIKDKKTKNSFSLCATCFN